MNRLLTSLLSAAVFITIFLSIILVISINSGNNSRLIENKCLEYLGQAGLGYVDVKRISVHNRSISITLENGVIIELVNITDVDPIYIENVTRCSYNE